MRLATEREIFQMVEEHLVVTITLYLINSNIDFDIRKNLTLDCHLILIVATDVTKQELDWLVTISY